MKKLREKALALASVAKLVERHPGTGRLPIQFPVRAHRCFSLSLSAPSLSLALSLPLYLKKSIKTDMFFKA